MKSEWEAASRYALLRASDLADEVWHLWLASEETENWPLRAAQPLAWCREKLLVHLGALRFIVDAGCGYILIAEKYSSCGRNRYDQTFWGINHLEHCRRFLTGPR
eukprot:8967481-Pyramimonas_sp.AAC.1